uniref:Uncharacterized protein n=1 Tax=Alexandrium andersonii TaxID=327968 RepID=A0A7S2FTT4_9DINO
MDGAPRAPTLQQREPNYLVAASLLKMALSRFAVAALLVVAGTARVDDSVLLVQKGISKSSDFGVSCKADSEASFVTCMGTDELCVKCVNGAVTCKPGLEALVDFGGKLHCATAAARSECLERGCRPGGCCEQAGRPPQLTKDKQVLMAETRVRRQMKQAASHKQEVKEEAPAKKPPALELMREGLWSKLG